MKKCPFCAEDIKAAAIKCRYCGEWLTLSGDRVGPGEAQRKTERKSTGPAGTARQSLREFDPSEPGPSVPHESSPSADPPEEDKLPRVQAGPRLPTPGDANGDTNARLRRGARVILAGAIILVGGFLTAFIIGGNLGFFGIVFGIIVILLGAAVLAIDFLQEWAKQYRPGKVARAIAILLLLMLAYVVGSSFDGGSPSVAPAREDVPSVDEKGEAQVRQEAENAQTIIGTWIDAVNSAWVVTYTLVEEDGKFFLIEKYQDSSQTRRNELVEEDARAGEMRRFYDPSSGSFQERFAIDEQGNLELYDREGYIREAPPVEAPAESEATTRVRGDQESVVWFAPVLQSLFPNGIPIHDYTYGFDEIGMASTDVTQFDLTTSSGTAALGKTFEIRGSVTINDFPTNLEMLGDRYMLLLQGYLFCEERLVWQQEGFPQGDPWIPASGGMKRFRLIDSYAGSTSDCTAVALAAGDPLLADETSGTRVILGIKRTGL